MKSANPLATAQALAAQGLQVLPARYKDKAPIVKWREYQDTRTEKLLPTWFGGGGNRNYWVMCGRISGVVVIDCDNPAADAWWREQVGDEVMDSAAIVATRKGRHYWFRLPEDWPEDKPIPSWSVHTSTLDFDFRADDTGVIAPPSVHESGHLYVWERPLSAAAVAPPAMLDGTLRGQAPADSAQAQDGQRRDSGGNTRSMLSSLLSKVPQGEGSGRNDWLSKVAGHYAKTYHNQEDLYRTHVEQANSMLSPPLDQAEFDKTVDSIWRGEHERNPQRALDASCGWLQSGGTRIMTQVIIKTGDDSKEYSIDEYADFDLQAKGVMLDEAGERTYWVQIVRKRRGVGDTETIDTVLPGHVTGDDRALRKWLARFACTIVPPDNMWPKSGTVGVRVQRYLESQHPPAVKVTNCLGWDPDIINGDGGFVTHDGVITADEVFNGQTCGVVPLPSLKTGGVAPHYYGFEHDLLEAKRVLSEVLSFHDEAITSVFGAWWAACLVKPQIEATTSLFPFVAIEAPSESGKTNGFFDLMTQLNGNTRGETQPTKAALRDMAAAHRNGMVWVDDLDDPAYLMELLRAATSGGSLTKMGEDRESVKNTRIVAPIVISGEALGLGTQKALLDRAILLKVGSPTGRMSRHDPSRPQWDDVLELRRLYPDGLAGLAGWLVQDALTVQEHVLLAVRKGREGGGRTGDKIGILRAGARLLDYLVATSDGEAEAAWRGDGAHARRVNAWIVGMQSENIGQTENSLTLEILPWAVRTFKYPEKPLAGERGDLDMPVFIRQPDPLLERTRQLVLGRDDTAGPEIWFNSALLAQAWERDKHGRVERRTQTEGAFKDQADALKAPAKRFKISGGGGRLAYYRKIDGELARTILERAQGK